MSYVRIRAALCLLAAPGLALGCSGDDSTNPTATMSDSNTETESTTNNNTQSSTQSGSDTMTASETDMSGSESMTESTTNGTMTTNGPTTNGPTTDPSTTDPSTTDPSTTDPSTTDPTSSTTGVPANCGDGMVDGNEACDDGPDNGSYGFCNANCNGTVGCGDGIINGPEDCDVDGQAYCDPDTCLYIPCDQQMGDPQPFEFSFIWIANSPEGTVSKINTETMVEEGRYRTGPNPGSPSRTAVNVQGRYAAVANRSGASVTVFAAADEYCVDADNDGQIFTSTGPGDVKPWGQDECMLWHLDGLAGVNGIENRGPRPLGWDFQDQDPITCEYMTHNLWMGWYQNGNSGRFYYLDGTDGTILQDVTVQPWGNNLSWGPYGGAVDKDHNFWVAGWHGPLVRIDGNDYSTQVWNDPQMDQWDSYGMALDAAGNPWFGGCSGQVAYFDVQNNTMQTVGADTGGCLRGLMVDSEDRAWIAGNWNCRLVEVDTIAKTVTNPNIAIPGCSVPVGISIDAEGYVWIVDTNGSAFKMDPDTYQVQSMGGLSSPYTYSDMTGAGIALQAIPQ